MSKITRIYVAVVDDDESACRSLGRLLRAGGFQATTYDSAESFLADKNRPQFGCLVLDIQLGGMSGIELAQKLVGEGVRTPTIFVTAHDDPEARREAEATGCAAYFRKTDSGANVLEAIRKVTV
ncbi:MAG: response regulator transcription factor [Terriglobales bacterium]